MLKYTETTTDDEELSFGNDEHEDEFLGEGRGREQFRHFFGIIEWTMKRRSWHRGRMSVARE